MARKISTNVIQILMVLDDEMDIGMDIEVDDDDDDSIWDGDLVEDNGSNEANDDSDSDTDDVTSGSAAVTNTDTGNSRGRGHGRGRGTAVCGNSTAGRGRRPTMTYNCTTADTSIIYCALTLPHFQHR